MIFFFNAQPQASHDISNEKKNYKSFEKQSSQYVNIQKEYDNLDKTGNLKKDQVQMRQQVCSESKNLENKTPISSKCAVATWLRILNLKPTMSSPPPPTHHQRTNS